MKRKPKRYQLVGRDAKTGRFIPVAAARKRKSSAIVQRIGFLLLMLACLPVMAATVTLQPSGAACVYLGATADASGSVVYNCMVHPNVPPTPIPTPPPPPPPPPAGCNPGAVRDPIPWGAGQAQSQMIQARSRSGEVFSYLLPPAFTSYTSLNFTQGQQPASGRANTEYSVSKCPGVIDKAPPDPCALRSSGVGYNVMTIWTNTAHAGACNALDPGPWYINVRWTWPTGCPYGDGNCGFTLQWASGT